MSGPVLRPYQVKCIAAMRHAYAAGARAPLLQLATGAGKTVIFAAIAAGVHEKGKRALVLVHRRELVRQAIEKLGWAGVACGVIAAGTKPDRERKVQVASVQTLARRSAVLGHVDLIVIDECHHAPAGAWARILDRFPTARLLGVSATPVRLDGKGLGIEAGGCFDEIVAGPPIKALVADGYLSPARVFVPSQHVNLVGVRRRRGDFVAGELAARIDTNVISGDAVEHYRANAAHLPAIAFCCVVTHAERVAERFRGAGYRAQCVHGGLPQAERDRLIVGLGTGEIEVLTSCDLISEGLDVPAVGAVILLRPTQSLGLYLQQVGRGMRPAPGKPALIVNDHVGNTLRHGAPDLDRIWTLAGVEKPEPEPAPAAQIGPGGIRQAPPEIAGHLAEISGDRLAALLATPYQIIRSARLSEPELRAYARHRGYQRGWVYHRLREQSASAS